ncbi:MAG: hypothetical protein Q4G46_07005 [Propionibacteriaceae bacterium]|nr:hypothetical protein [Propionibacteriaceae bacterium]
MSRRLTKQQLAGGVMALVSSSFALVIMSIRSWSVPTDPTRPDYSQPRFRWWDPVLIEGGNVLPMLAAIFALIGALAVLFSLLSRRPLWVPVVAYSLAILSTIVGVLVNGAWYMTTAVLGVLFTALGMSILLMNKPKQDSPHPPRRR